jgi:DMSO reductase anchor subunit
VYRTKRALPRNLLPADYYRTNLEHSHPALVIMLTFTQLAVGAFCLTYATERWSGRAPGSPLLQSVAATGLALLALAASIFHLGRPLHAWRAFLGLRTSWLSREAVGFGLFALLATVYGSLAFAQLLPSLSQRVMLTHAAETVRVVAAAVGATSVLCSVMVYVATRRAHWSATHTGIRFFGTTLVLGSALVLVLYLLTGGAIDRTGAALLAVILLASLCKLALDASTLAHYRARQLSPLKRVALLMLGDLAGVTSARLSLATIGGVVLPVLLLNGALGGQVRGIGLLLLVLLVAAELLERYLFFRTAPASRMPGALR